jgi:hypothetical protein
MARRRVLLEMQLSKLTQDRQNQQLGESRSPGSKLLVQQPREGSPDAPVDRWVKDQLQQVYDDVVLEPVPQDFLNLLKKIDQKNQ